LLDDELRIVHRNLDVELEDDVDVVELTKQIARIDSNYHVRYEQELVRAYLR